MGQKIRGQLPGLITKPRIPNPHCAPEVQVSVCLLNFTITPVGLSDQMVGVVVSKESPELEQKKNALVVSNARMKKQLQDTEDLILRLLTEAAGSDILDDEQLIDTLADSKKVSEEISPNSRCELERTTEICATIDELEAKTEVK